MDRRSFCDRVLGFFVMIGILVPPVVAADMTEGDRLLLETTQILGTVSGASDKFSLVQKYFAQRQLVTDYFERTYRGQTVDWEQLPATLKAK